MNDFFIFIAHHLALTYGMVAIFVLVMIVEFLRVKRLNFTINVAKAVQLINRENAVVIDIRASDAYKNGHIIEALSLPATDVTANPKKLEKYRSRPIIVVCNTGLEAQKIAALLIKQGYNIYSLAGGTRAWTDAQMPLVKE